MTEKVFVPSFIAKMVKVFKVENSLETAVAEDDSKIRVNQAIGRVSLIYEKLRNVVDYNDEHLIRKNAIFRIMKRLISIEGRVDGLGLHLIQDLIRINHLPNNTILESSAHGLDRLLEKYLTIEKFIDKYYKGRFARRLFIWFLQIAACEVEDYLFDFRERQASIIAMTKVLKRDIELPSGVNEKNQDILFNLTALKSFFKSDEGILHYYLLSQFYPNFFGSDPNLQDVERLVQNWNVEQSRMEKYLSHPLRNKLNKIGRRYAVYFLILREVLAKNRDRIEDIVTHPRVLTEEVATVCSQRYKEIRIKVVRSVVRSVIYIFITKMVLAMLLEIPFEYFLQQGLNYSSILINVLFPPVLMLAISLLIRLPKQKNTEKIIHEIKDIVYQKEGTEQKKYHIRHGLGRGTITRFFFNIIYLITYGITFGVVIWFLNKIHFNILSGGIFIFFLCIVSFFAINIRLRARELIVLDNREGFINLLFDFFSLPIVRLGRWLSVKLSKINVFVFIMDFIIEAPLKIILEVLEDWFSFMREKKEEIY
ncbi:MAG: hypothetical protein WC310_04920 [Patescibacteria group bacterium]|jgi:hypothetical protein